jgi:hypothetical protein
MNDNLQFESLLIENLKRLIRTGYLYAKQAHDAVFDEHVGELAGVAYLQRASSKFSAAESLYYSRYDAVARDEAEEILTQFDSFADELIEDFATDHSQQWTDIEFNRLTDTLENSVFRLESR